MTAKSFKILIPSESFIKKSANYTFINAVIRHIHFTSDNVMKVDDHSLCTFDSQFKNHPEEICVFSDNLSTLRTILRSVPRQPVVLQFDSTTGDDDIYKISVTVQI
ncbi:hypothetical protein [Rhizosphaericola mali]|uniref:Uncharacterized protein n=1 Tax=Rhizosphaericola mali TaxID=2545455 RepID=A0A5P2G030_9BACT|nr:hypothetical protein [Rhizosphaericola mali]QES88845.1 hypothetical protein E0W69_009325 [Rhizosphaericola mali]